MNSFNWLEERLQHTPYKLQFAVNRQWEKAWKFVLPNINYSDPDINDFLGSNIEVVAGEIFYRTKENKDFYLGIQYDSRLRTTSTAHDFVKSYLDSVRDFQGAGFKDLVLKLGKAFDNNEDLFVFDKPSSIVLGVVDYWMSEGPCVIWKTGEKTLSKNDLQEKLNSHPNLIKNKKNYIGLEFVFDNRIPKHWLSFQVAEKKGDTFELNTNSIDEIIHASGLF